MPTWAEVGAVRDRALGVDEDFTDQQINTLVEDAEDAVLKAFPAIEDQITAGKVRKATVVRVVAGMVIRVLRNPDGIRTIQDSDGPHSGSTTFAGDNPGQINLSDDDKRDLTPAGSGGRRAFSVMPNYARR